MILFSSCLLPYAISVSKEDPFVRILPYPDSHVTEVEGVMVHYRLGVAETSRGKILLIHGLGGSTSSFDTVIGPLVDAGYLVVAVDLPGFGYSGRPEGFDHSQMHRAALVWQLLDELERTAGTDPWIILGHSMGGGTAVAMACQRPGSTRSVVLVCRGPPVSSVRTMAQHLSRTVAHHRKTVLRHPCKSLWTGPYGG